MPCLFIGDLKILNTVWRLQQPSATYGCVYCERDLLSGTSEEQLSAGTPRTYNNIQQHVADFNESKGSDHDPKYHASCKAEPLALLAVQPDRHVDHSCGIPALHLMLSANWIINHIERLVPEVEEWYRAYHFVRQKFHGGDLQGNQIRHLLRKRSRAALREIIDDVAPLSADTGTHTRRSDDTNLEHCCALSISSTPSFTCASESPSAPVMLWPSEISVILSSDLICHDCRLNFISHAVM